MNCSARLSLCRPDSLGRQPLWYGVAAAADSANWFDSGYNQKGILFSSVPDSVAKEPENANPAAERFCIIFGRIPVPKQMFHTISS